MTLASAWQTLKNPNGRAQAFQSGWQKFRSNKVLRHAAQMGGFRFLSLAISAGGSIWASRCLGPENVGMSGVILALIAQLTLFVTLNQDIALVRRYKKLTDVEAQNDLITSVFTFRLTMAVFAIVVVCIVLFFIKPDPAWNFLILMGTAMFLLSTNTPNWLLQARENVPAQYRMATVQAVIAVFLIAAFFRPGIRAGSDLAVSLIATLVASFLTWRIGLQGRHRLRLNLKKVRDILPLLWEGRWIFLSGLLIYIYTSSEQPLLSWLSSVHELGQYRSGLQIANALAPFLAMAPALFYPRYLEWIKESSEFLWQKQLGIAKVFCLFLVPAAFLVCLIGPRVHPLIFGPKFAPAAWPCALLLCSKLVILLNGVFSFGLWARGKDKSLLAIMFATAAASLTLNVIFIPRFGMNAAAVVNIVSELLILAGTFFWTRSSVHQARRNDLVPS